MLCTGHRAAERPGMAGRHSTQRTALVGRCLDPHLDELTCGMTLRPVRKLDIYPRIVKDWVVPLCRARNWHIFAQVCCQVVEIMLRRMHLIRLQYDVQFGVCGNKASRDLGTLAQNRQRVLPVLRELVLHHGTNKRKEYPHCPPGPPKPRIG